MACSCSWWPPFAFRCCCFLKKQPAPTHAATRKIVTRPSGTPHSSLAVTTGATVNAYDSANSGRSRSTHPSRGGRRGEIGGLWILLRPWIRRTDRGRGTYHRTFVQNARRVEPEPGVAALRAYVVAVRRYVPAGRGLEREGRRVLAGDELRDRTDGARRGSLQQRVQCLDAAAALDERVAGAVVLRRVDQPAPPDGNAAVLLRAAGSRRERQQERRARHHFLRRRAGTQRVGALGCGAGVGGATNGIRGAPGLAAVGRWRPITRVRAVGFGRMFGRACHGGAARSMDLTDLSTSSSSIMRTKKMSTCSPARVNAAHPPSCQVARCVDSRADPARCVCLNFTRTPSVA